MRNQIAELLAARQRAGKYKRTPAKHDVEDLKRVWQEQLKGVGPTDDLIPIRIVTLLEVFVRDWIERLIDQGAPYVERAASLKADIRYDFAIASSLQGGSISLGQLIAHSVTLNRLENIAAILSTLINHDFFAVLSKTRDLWMVKHQGDEVMPIISDVSRVRRSLSRLFEARHILVHELPQEKPYAPGEIDDFLSSAAAFMEATEEELRTRLYGPERRSQSEMTREAASLHKAAVVELEALCVEIAKQTPEIDEVQELWKAFKEAEAERQTQRRFGGSIRPMIYSMASEDITRKRIRELKEWYENRAV